MNAELMDAKRDSDKEASCPCIEEGIKATKSRNTRQLKKRSASYKKKMSRPDIQDRTYIKTEKAKKMTRHITEAVHRQFPELV